MKRFLFIFLMPLFILSGKAQDIIKMEYFIDNDPGLGNGTEVSITPGPEILKNFNIGLTGLENGFHMLYMRVCNDQGNWGTTQHYPFLAFDNSTLPGITKLEYFTDTDPGFGNGTPVALTSGTDIVHTFELDVNNISGGLHNLYLRAQDANGLFSITHSALMFISAPISDITGIEYFIDNDPGFGLGSQVPVTPGKDIVRVFNIQNDSIPEGIHTLYVRVKDEAGNWSMSNAANFYSTAVNSKITQMEYFCDDDPGFGNGIPVPIGSNYDVKRTFTLDLTGLTPGTHTLYVRVKNIVGKWSVVSNDKFYLLDLKVFIEGPFDPVTSNMKTDLNTKGYLPLTQPYGANPNAVWYYNGNESVSSIPNVNTVDWVIVQTRDAATASQADRSTIRESRPAFLLKSGTVKNLNGFSYVLMTEDIEQNMYVVIYHRNHLGIMSANPVPLDGPGAGEYNFHTSAAQTLGGSTAVKQIAANIWSMVSSDGNPDGNVNNSDKNEVWAPQAGTGGYKAGDFNLNGEVNNADKNECWKPNTGRGSQIPGG